MKWICEEDVVIVYRDSNSSAMSMAYLWPSYFWPYIGFFFPFSIHPNGLIRVLVVSTAMLIRVIRCRCGGIRYS